MMIESDENLRKEQTALLKDFIAFRMTTDEFCAKDKLHFITDNEYYDDLVMLTRQDVINVLERYLRGELPSMELHYWGVLVEARETIGREPSYRQAIGDVIRYFSEVIAENNPLRSEVAQSLIDGLKNAEKDRYPEPKITPITENDG